MHKMMIPLRTAQLLTTKTLGNHVIDDDYHFIVIFNRIERATPLHCGYVCMFQPIDENDVPGYPHIFKYLKIHDDGSLIFTPWPENDQVECVRVTATLEAGYIHEKDED